MLARVLSWAARPAAAGFAPPGPPAAAVGTSIISIMVSNSVIIIYIYIYVYTHTYTYMYIHVTSGLAPDGNAPEETSDKSRQTCVIVTIVHARNESGSTSKPWMI